MLYSIQFLRGIAALLVVFHHTAYKGQVYNTGTFGWLTIGSSGVDLFVISGFIMCYTTHDKDITFTKFIMHRIKRIIPLYWFFLCGIICLYICPFFSKFFRWKYKCCRFFLLASYRVEISCSKWLDLNLRILLLYYLFFNHFVFAG